MPNVAHDSAAVLRNYLPVGDKASPRRTVPITTQPALVSSEPLDYEMAANLDDAGDNPDELVERMLTTGAMTVLYGESNSGKTFFAIDLACAIDRGIPFMGRNTEAGLVVYLAAESPASVRMRLRAYQQHNGCKLRNLAVVRSPVDLFDGQADTMRVIQLVRDLEASLAVPCVLVVGDTLSRLSAGANENSGEDMSLVVRHVDHIRQETGAHFLLIHHSGKDSTRGARGWSGLRAATDTEIEVTADPITGVHAAEITKQRDIAGKGERIGFRLEVVEMGTSKWGKPVTSCVLVSADAPPKVTQCKRPSEIAGAITELLTSRGAGMRKGEMVQHFEGRYTSSGVYRELKKMEESGKVRVVVGIVGLVKP